jgi:hypothetical protein
MPDRQPPSITRLAEYSGEPSVRLHATQLGTDYSPTQARKVVAEWAEYFASGPSPIQELRLVTRTPKRLFDSLAGQTQLRLLAVKWGDYDDLAPLSGLRELHTLALRGASKVTDLEPLAALQNVETLDIEGFVRLDLAPIAKMRSVADLDLGGNWMTPRTAHVNSISFLRQMPQLRRLILHTMIVDDLDYSPILDLPNLEGVRVMKVRGMRPSHEELIARTPWSD